MKNRAIAINLSPDQITAIAEITGNEKLQAAIGYLSLWNLSLPICEIVGGVYDGIPEMIAIYRAEDRGPILYNIGAVWHPSGADYESEGHFGFHS